jgi:hypothetical protein
MPFSALSSYCKIEVEVRDSRKSGGGAISRWTRCTSVQRSAMGVGTLLLRLMQTNHKAARTPQFDIVTVYKLLGPYDCIAVVSRFERSITNNMTIVTDDECAVLSHLGEDRPGEQSHSLIWEAVSICRALRRRSSRV